jgi:hypothetical protein
MESKRGPKVRDCQYGAVDAHHPELSFGIGGPIALYQGTWSVKAVDPSTGKLVKELTAQGQGTCPTKARVMVRGSDYTSLPGSGFRTALSPLVEPR